MKQSATPLLITVLSFTILIYLGFWQVARLNYKEALVHQINTKLSKPSTFLPQHFNPTSLDTYTKYKLRGRFLQNKDMLLYLSNSSHPEKHGYFVITPFVTENNETILINRGWIPQSYSKAPKDHNWQAPDQMLNINAIIMLPQPPGIFMPENDIKNNVWLYMDLKAMEAFASTKTQQKFYMVLLEGENLPEGLTIFPAQNFMRIKNDHLWYAITWFSLAFAVVVVYYLKTRRSTAKIL